MKRIQGSGAERLVEALDQEIRGRGRGTIGAVNRATGHSEGWWQHRAESGDITARQLLQILDHLGLDPVKFVRRALGAEVGLELDRPTGEPPEIVPRAWRRLESTETGSVGMGFLDSLDRQRYQEPAKAVSLALWAVDHVELSLLPRLLGIAGSASRLLIQLNEAEHAIHAGIEMAERTNDRSALGNLLQRLSYVVADCGDRVEALKLAESAALVFLRLGDWEGLAKATVEQGIWLYYLKRFEESIEAHKSALDLLPENCSRYRCTIHQYLGLNCRELHHPRQAMEHLTDAESVAAAAEIEEWAQSKLTWLRARIHADLGELDQAASLFAAVVETFRDLHPGEAALATCELVRIQILRKQPEEAYLAATSMRVLIEPLRHNKIISAAIADLLRCSQAGLTLALVKQVQARIESERKHHQKMWQLMKAHSFKP